MKTANQYNYGLERDLPRMLPPGSFYITTDTKNIFLYGDTMLPVKVTGLIPDTDIFLDKVTLESQIVAGPVEFLEDITVPSGSVILGKNGARLSSTGRGLQYTDARERFTLFVEYHFTDAGGETPHYWDIDPVQTNFPVCPDEDGTILTGNIDLPFVGSLGSTMTRAIYIRPNSIGTLKLQIWEGSDSLGPVLVERDYEITTLDPVRLEFPVPVITEGGDLQYVRLTGVDLLGAVQTTGAFVGQLCPFLEFDVHLLTEVPIGGAAPVDSVNGYTGVVVLDADDVGASKSGDNVSDFTNDAGYLTSETPAPVDSVNGEVGVVVLDTGDIAEITDKNYVTDAEATIIGNTSGTNTGDQDLSGKADVSHTHTESDITDLGTYSTDIHSNITALDNVSGTNTGDQDLSALALRDGDDLTDTDINGVRLKTNQGVFKFLDGNGDYNIPGGSQYAELYNDVTGIQKLKTTDEVMEFSVIGLYNGLVPNAAGNKITIPSDGNYNIQYQGSAIFKRDYTYNFWIGIDGVTGEAIGCNLIADDNMCHSFSYGRILYLEAGEEITIVGQSDSGTDKDWKHQIGTRFIITKL